MAGLPRWTVPSLSIDRNELRAAGVARGSLGSRVGLPLPWVNA
jgi:hypothetical protein